MGPDGTNKAVVASGLDQMRQKGTDRTDATNEWDRTKRMKQDCRKVTGPTGQDRTTGKRQDHQNWMGPTGHNGINGF